MNHKKTSIDQRFFDQRFNSPAAAADLSMAQARPKISRDSTCSTSTPAAPASACQRDALPENAANLETDKPREGRRAGDEQHPQHQHRDEHEPLPPRPKEPRTLPGAPPLNPAQGASSLGTLHTVPAGGQRHDQIDAQGTEA